MSVELHAAAFLPPGDEYNKKRAAYLACESAGVPVPKELKSFFGGEYPDENGARIRLMDLDTGSIPLRGFGALAHPCATAWKSEDGMCIGIQIDVTQLPPGARYVRFYCSY